MHARTHRALGLVVAGAAVLALTVTPAASAATAASATASRERPATGEWEVTAYYPDMFLQSSREGYMPGRPGNWHTMWVTVETSDDWVTGSVVDYQCPPGDRPPPINPPVNTCKIVRDIWIQNDIMPVTMDERMRLATAKGPVAATDMLTGEPTTVNLDLTWYGRGAYTNLVPVEWFYWTEPNGTRMQSRSIQAQRDGVVVKGFVDDYDLSARRAVTPLVRLGIYWDAQRQVL